MIAISPAVMQTLEAALADGPALRLVGDLPRPLYLETAKVLEALGGKWNRKARATIFDGDAADIIEGVLQTGEYARVKQDLGQFDTPPAVVARVMALAAIADGEKVLEPSAGLGNLVAAAKADGGHVWAYEIDPKRHARLYGAYFSAGGCVCKDFLTVEPNPVFDVVVMNPPFARQADIAHVMHAARFLRPGGRLVAVMSASVTFRQNGTATVFGEWLAQHGGKIEMLPEGAFAESGTMIRACIVSVSL